MRKPSDPAKQIQMLYMLIMSICDEHKLSKRIVLDDLCYLFFPNNEYLVKKGDENAGS